MKWPLLLFASVALLLAGVNTAVAQTRTEFLSKDDLSFLASITRAVVDSARILPDQVISKDFGPNNTRGTLIRPGGRDDYPSFWIRDYAMSLESGFITSQEQKHMLMLTASSQCDRTWITKNGSLVPLGAIPDHIRIDDGKPIYFPGTYSYEDQGNKAYGSVPPYCDQFYFIQMAYYYVTSTGDKNILTTDVNGLRLIDRLELSFNTPPSRANNHIVYTTDAFRGVDFGFRDGIQITGDLSFPSILKYKASAQLVSLFNMLNQPRKSSKYRQIATTLRTAIPEVFRDRKGLLRASNGLSAQRDVWATALAVYYGILEGQDLHLACEMLTNAYTSGTLAYKGHIRHILTSDDFNNKTAWEKTDITKNKYQNGAYWSTPTGWVCYAIAFNDPLVARKLAKDFVRELRENDFRKGGHHGAPYECIHPSSYKQNPVYMTSVTCPYAVFMGK